MRRQDISDERATRTTGAEMRKAPALATARMTSTGADAPAEEARHARLYAGHPRLPVSEKDVDARVKPAHGEVTIGHDARPPAQGMYDPALDKDSCGVGFI